jgi:type I restriction enzyme, S subunit
MGKISLNVQFLKLKYVADIYRGKFTHRPRNDPKLYDGPYPFLQTGDVARANKFIETYSQTLNELGRQASACFPSRTIVMSIAANIGDVAITTFDAYFPDSVVGFRPKSFVDSGFLFYLLLGMKEGFDQEATENTQKNLNVERVGNVKVCLPDIDYQIAIAQFLDRKTTAIDTLIAKKQRLIALLEEKRSALINQAVTKGLDRAVRMKDSGIPWIGEIPEHWEVMRIKFLILGIEGGFSPQCYGFPPSEGEWGVLKTGCVNGGIFNPQESKTLPEDIPVPIHLKVIQGDVLMSRASGSLELIASVALVTEEPKANLLLSDKTFRLSLKQDVCDAPFFVIAMGSKMVRQQIHQVISGAEGLANNIAQSAIRELLIVLPPLMEQREMMKKLEPQISLLDRYKKQTNVTIEKLQEYRQSLITAAVTGKLPIPD